MIEIVDVGIDPGTSGAIAALDGGGLPVLLADLPIAKLGAGGRSIVDAGRLARLLLDLAGVSYSPPDGTEFPRWRPAKRRLRVWLEQVGPGKGEGVSSVFTFGGAYRAAQATVEALAEERPDAFVLHAEPALASGRAAVALVLPAKWARSAGLPPVPDRDARLVAYHDAARHRWPALDRRSTAADPLALLGPRGGANYNKAAALWIADHGRKLAAIGGAP